MTFAFAPGINEHYTDYLYIVNASGKNITLMSREDRESPGTEVILSTDQMAVVCFYTVEDIVERDVADLQMMAILVIPGTIRRL